MLINHNKIFGKFEKKLIKFTRVNLIAYIKGPQTAARSSKYATCQIIEVLKYFAMFPIIYLFQTNQYFTDCKISAVSNLILEIDNW